MALEDLTGTKYISDLVATNPAADDNLDKQDDHTRGIKNVLKLTFPNLSGAMTATQAELNSLTGAATFIKDFLADANKGDAQAELFGKGSDISSATPTIDTDGLYFDVTGTTTITAFTVAAGRLFVLQFDGALTLTHHATNLNLPGGANIVTGAGDHAVCFAPVANQTMVLHYQRAKKLLGTDELIDHKTASASATIEFTGLTSLYANHYVLLNNVRPATDARNIVAQVSSSGTWRTASYLWGVRDINLTTPSTSLVRSADTFSSSYDLSGNSSVGNSAGYGFSGRLDVWGLTSSSKTRFNAKGFYLGSGGAGNDVRGGGEYGTAEVHDGIRFKYVDAVGADSGNIAAGEFRLYGVRGLV